MKIKKLPVMGVTFTDTVKYGGDIHVSPLHLGPFGNVTPSSRNILIVTPVFSVGSHCHPTSCVCTKVGSQNSGQHHPHIVVRRFPTPSMFFLSAVQLESAELEWSMWPSGRQLADVAVDPSDQCSNIELPRVFG